MGGSKRERELEQISYNYWVKIEREGENENTVNYSKNTTITIEYVAKIP